MLNTEYNRCGFGIIPQNQSHPRVSYIVDSEVNSVAEDTTLMAESKEELKSLLMKEESEKVGLKLNIQKIEILASSLIISWLTDGETAKTVAGFIFWSSKITADSDGSNEIKKYLLLGRKVMINLDSILKSRDIALSI